MSDDTAKKYTVIFQIAVVPFYRNKFFSQLKSELNSICDLQILTAEKSQDDQVVTDKKIPGIKFQNILALPYGFYWLRGYAIKVLRCNMLVIEKNPRSLNAWFFLLLRRINGRRTYIWGHSKSRTNDSRISRLSHHLMNLLANGIYLYTDEEMLNIRVNKRKVHIAPNAIMFESECSVVENSTRTNIIYSGRLERSKDLEKLVLAFAASNLSKNGSKLIIIGEGSCRKSLQLRINEIGYSNKIDLPGEISDTETLRNLYASARIAIGPGYGGLNITQANCFGVPIVLDKFGKHAPEIALRKFNGVILTDFSSLEDMTQALELFFKVLDWDVERRKILAKKVSEVYCISSMSRVFANEIILQAGIGND